MTADPPPGTPSLSSSDRLLSSFISLPKNPCINYSIFTPIQNDSLHGQDSINSIEYARRKLVLSTNTSSLFHRHLPSVRVGRDPALYVFSITSHEHAPQSLSTLHELVFDGLVGEQHPCLKF
jgi:Mediator complex subunit 13 N-terminal